MQIRTKVFHKPIKVCDIEIRVRLTKLWDFKDEGRPISINLRKVKINDMKTVTFLTTFKVVYFNADNNMIIPQVHRGMPYRNPSSLDQVVGF